MNVRIAPVSGAPSPLIAISMRYDARLVEEARALPTRHWDPDRTRWTVYVTKATAPAIRAFAERHRALTPTLDAMLAAAPESESRLMPVGHRAALSFDYDPGLISKVRALDAKWRPEIRAWMLPRRVWPAGVALADAAGIPVHPAIRSAAVPRPGAPHRPRHAASDGIPTATPPMPSPKPLRPDPSVVVPEDLRQDLHLHQTEAVQTIVGAGPGGYLVADEMGLGKTVTALAVLRTASALPAVIVAPASVMGVWEEHVRAWIPDASVDTRVGGGAATDPYADITIISWDSIHAQLDHLPHRLAAVFLDEIHLGKRRRARRSRAAETLARRARLRLGLTGTPITRDLGDLVQILAILGRLEELGGRAGVRDRLGLGIGHGRATARVEEAAALLRGVMIRRTKDDVLDLPPKSRCRETVPVADPDAYRQAEHEALSIEEPLAALTRLRQLAGEQKVDAALALIRRRLEGGEPVVVFAHHRAVQERLARELGALWLHGGLSPRQRTEVVRRFQDGESDVLVASLEAGSLGVTLTRAALVVMAELSWSAATHAQAEDRVHRIGQSRPTEAIYLVAAGTVDDEVFQIIEAKRGLARAVVGGDESFNPSQLVDAMREARGLPIAA